jgi:hypothetical protein
MGHFRWLRHVSRLSTTKMVLTFGRAGAMAHRQRSPTFRSHFSSQSVLRGELIHRTLYSFRKVACNVVHSYLLSGAGGPEVPLFAQPESGHSAAAERHCAVTESVHSALYSHFVKRATKHSSAYGVQFLTSWAERRGTARNGLVARPAFNDRLAFTKTEVRDE